MATYGLQRGEYAKLLEAQGGKCAVCLKVLAYKPHVDHDHKTGAVRGLLCKSDNSHVLKYARDDPERLRRAASYLEHPPAEWVLGFRAKGHNPNRSENES